MPRSAAVTVMTPAEPGIAAHLKTVLELIGEKTSRDGLVRTPERWEKAIRFLTSGYNISTESILNGALFDVKNDQIVLVKDIEFFSLCEHHILPFYGRVHVAYLPAKKVIGLSKIPRIVNMFARRLQVQERLTQQVAEAIHEAIAPRGVAVRCEASHFCMMMRGVEKQRPHTVTSAMLGEFRNSKVARDEFLSLLSRGALSR